MRGLRRVLSTAAGILIASTLHAHVEPVKEAEPNDTASTATPLTTTTSCFAAWGAIATAGDVDYFSVTVPANSRFWAIVDPGKSTWSTDSTLTLLAPDGTTVLERNEDGALASGCDATVESNLGSAIAGRTLTAAGTYFLRIEASDPAWILAQYTLLVCMTSDVGTETEPNDSSAKATPIVTEDSPIGVRRGAVRGGDVDFYSVLGTTVGSVLQVTLAPDSRPPVKPALGIDLFRSNGKTLLSRDGGPTANDPSGTTTFCFILNDKDTYFIRVHAPRAAKGSPPVGYTLLVAACGVHDMAAMGRSSPAAPTPTPAPRVPPTATPGSP